MNTYKKLFKYLHPFVIDLYPLMGVGVGAHVLGQVLSLAILPIFYQRIVDSLVPEMQGSLLVYQEAYLAVGLFVLITVVYRAGDYLNAKIQSRLMARLNKVVFHKFINRDYHFYLNNFSGSLVAKFSKFSLAVVNVYDILNYHILGTVVGLLAVFIVLSQYSWLLVGIFALWTVLYLAISIFWSKKRAHTSLLKTQSFSRLTGRLSDTLSNIGQVKSFGKESFEEDHFGDENDNWSNLTLRDWNTYVHGLTATSVLTALFQAGLVFVSIFLWNKGLITTGFVVLLLLYLRTLMARIRNLGKALPNLSAALSNTQEVIEILEEPIAVLDENTHDIALDNHTIKFNNISFTYPDGDHVFEDFNLEIPQGQKIGIVGRSGSGKTSLIKLLLRFYDPSKGSVTVGGQNIYNISQQRYRTGYISFIPQETTLFHRSLRENILYGDPDVSEELFHEVVTSSYVDEFASRLDDGYDTKVGEHGIRLSGGQRQRVGIARAMLKSDAPILVMDEATSALDSQSEQYIQDSFEKLSEGRTTIVIAHRLSTIQKMDRILVMEYGKIIEDGSHDELLKKNAAYSQLWKSQSGGFITD